MENVFIERLWRRVKYAEFYLPECTDGHELNAGLKRYSDFYNNERRHTGIGKRTPAANYAGG